MPHPPSLLATRYVQPLREGGSLPAVVETEDGALWVVKFRGAGQGAKVLIAELLAGMLARTLGLPVPDLALIEITPPFGRTEPDPEIQDLLEASQGVNVGLRYLDGAFNFDGTAAGELVSPSLAARIVWFDALLTNPDRTARNPNLLVWRRTPWLIDHGSALYAHHDWSGVNESRTRTPFPLIRDHVLLGRADDVLAADAELASRLDGPAVDDALAAVPDALLLDPVSGADFPNAGAARARYREYLLARLRAPREFAAEADRARDLAQRTTPRRIPARR